MNRVVQQSALAAPGISEFATGVVITCNTLFKTPPFFFTLLKQYALITCHTLFKTLPFSLPS